MANTKNDVVTQDIEIDADFEGEFSFEMLETRALALAESELLDGICTSTSTSCECSSSSSSCC